MRGARRGSRRGPARERLRFNPSGPNGKQWLSFIGAVACGLLTWWDVSDGWDDPGRRGAGPYGEILGMIATIVLLLPWLSGFTLRTGRHRRREPVSDEMAETVKDWFTKERSHWSQRR